MHQLPRTEKLSVWKLIVGSYSPNAVVVIGFFVVVLVATSLLAAVIGR